jgi:DNA polymerase III epsilon subunit-like protein
MFYLVIDFETNGVGQDAQNGYKPHPPERAPLPRPNYPVQLAAELLNPHGTVVRSAQMLVSGAQRLDPWVITHCPHIRLEDCNHGGVDFAHAVRVLADMAGDDCRPCTLVAHNIQYDWDEVLCVTAATCAIEETPEFRRLASLPRHCTCVNEENKRAKTSYYFQRIGRWIGPKLSALAHECGVAFDPARAHDAAYDVRVTSQCLVYLKRLHAPA